MGQYALLPPGTPAEWQAYHDIRRMELFEARGRFGVYDPDHPDESAPSNQPLLLRCEGVPMGTVRLDDFGDGTGAIRMVAIQRSEQGKGHGRGLMDLAERAARERGIHTLHLNAAPTAVGFYDKLGWERFVWSEAELTNFAADCTQMRKRI